MLELDAGLGRFLLLDQVEHDAPQDGEVVRTVTDVQPGIILVEDDIQQPVALVLDLPVRTDAAVEFFGLQRGRADVVAPLGAGLALVLAAEELAGGLDHDGRAHRRPEFAHRIPHGAEVMCHHAAAGIAAGVPLVDGDVLLQLPEGHITDRVVERRLDGLRQIGLVVLGRQDEVGPAFDDLVCYLALAADGVDADRRPAHVQHVQQQRHGRDLVALGRRAALRQRQPAGRLAQRHQMHHRLLATARAPHALAIDGQRRPRQRRAQRLHPPHEARLELLCVEQRKHPVEGVMRGNAMLERQPAPQPLQLHATPVGHVHPVLGPAGHPRQRHQQQLLQRVAAARAVSRVDQIGERRQIAQWVFRRARFHPADSDLLRCRVAVVAPHRSLSRRFQWLSRQPLPTDTVVQLPWRGCPC